MKIRCVIACHDANGRPDLVGCTANVSRAQQRQGEHRKQAKACAHRNRLEKPFIVFDEEDGPDWLFKNVFDSVFNGGREMY